MACNCRGGPTCCMRVHWPMPSPGPWDAPPRTPLAQCANCGTFFDYRFTHVCFYTRHPTTMPKFKNTEDVMRPLNRLFQTDHEPWE